MWKKFIAVFCKAQKRERGQTLVEYVLVLVVIVGIIILLVRPFLGQFLGSMRGSFQDASIFKEDGSGFYYFPVR